MKYTMLYKKITKAATLFMLALILTLGANAQPGGGLEEDVDTPIDGGLSLALAAGAGYLVKRRHDAKKKAAKDQQILP